jgi:hypothetical protein
VPDLIAQHAQEIETVKRTPAIPFTAGNDELLAVAAPFAGQAGQQQAFYVLFGKRPANADLAALLKNTSSDDLKWGHFPWIPLASGVFLAVVIGLLLIRSEGEKPMIRLRAELKQLARGEIFKIQDLHYGGRFGGLARDINAAIEHYTHAPSAPSAMAGKDLNAILGDSAGGKAFDLPSPGSAFASPPPPSFPPPPPPSGFPPPPPAGFAPPPPAFAPPPPPVFAPPPPFSAASIPSLDADIASAGPEATRVVASADDVDEETHFKNIFDDFVATKRECGESLVGLTLDKFKDKLRGNKDALMSKHQCRTVRFAVYVKDGRAALKATPIRD